MKNLCRLLSMVAAATMLFVPTSTLWAQAEKPVAVVAIESVEKLFQDMDYLTKSADQADAGMMARGMATSFMEGVDTQRSAGVVVTTDGTDFKVVGFVPVSDMSKVLATLQKNPMIGGVEDAGDGMHKVGGAQPMYLKESGGWAFAAQAPDHLSDLPADPTTLLEGLDKKYAMAVRLYAQNIPANYKDMADGLIKEGIGPGMERLPGESDDEYALRKKMMTNQLDQMKMLMEETDQVTIGWAVDSAEKQTYLDVDMTAVPGTKMAEQMAQLAETTSEYAGFVREDAAMTMHFVSKISGDDIDQVTGMLDTVRENTMKEIAKENLGEEGEQTAKEVIGLMFDVADSTLKSGKMDGGAVVLLGENPCVVAGGHVADGKKLDEALRKLAKLAAEEPDFPEIQWDADVQSEVSLHTMAIPVPEGDGQDMFGPTAEVVIGVSDSSVYIAAGTNAATTLKEIIVDSAGRTGEKMPPVQMTIALTPIAKFAAKLAPPAEMVVGALEASAGNDRISFVEKPIQNGVNVRFTVDEGVIKAIGAGIAAFADMGTKPGPAPDGFDDGF